MVPKNIRFRFFSIRNQSKEKFMILKRKNRRMAKKVLIIGLAQKHGLFSKRGLIISKENSDSIRNISFGKFRFHRFL